MLIGVVGFSSAVLRGRDTGTSHAAGSASQLLPRPAEPAPAPPSPEQANPDEANPDEALPAPLAPAPGAASGTGAGSASRRTHPFTTQRHRDQPVSGQGRAEASGAADDDDEDASSGSNNDEDPEPPSSAGLIDMFSALDTALVGLG